MTLRKPAARLLPTRFIAAMLSGLLCAFTSRADVLAEVQGLVAQGQLPAALRQAQAALKTTPDSARLRFVHALILLDMQRNLDAMSAFVAMTQDFPQLSEPYNNIATLHARAGQWEQARTALETALRNDPGHKLARENLGDVHLQLALQAWQQAASGASEGQGLQRKIRLATQLATPIATPAPFDASTPRPGS